MLFEPVARAVDFDRDGTVKQLVQKGDGEVWVAEVFTPGLDVEVRGNDGGRASVACLQDLVQELGFLRLLLLQRVVAEIVDLSRAAHKSTRLATSRTTPGTPTCSSRS